MSTIRIALHGAGGRMGRALVTAMAAMDDMELVGATDSPNSAVLGQDSGTLAGVGANGILITDTLEEAFAAADVVIEFTRPNGTMRAIETLAASPRKLVTGTTGLDPEQQQRLADYARKHATVVQAANFSVGVNLAVKLTELAARVLDENADVEIIEAHHRDKVDAPSGTALLLGRAAAEATGRSLEGDAVYARVGQTGARPPRAIGFATVRGGDIVGDHTVLFAGQGEQVEIRHRATSRANFATGALRAARWVMGVQNGLHDMPEVLGLNSR